MDMKRPCTRYTVGDLVIGIVFVCIILSSSVPAASHTVHKVLGKMEFALEPSVWYSPGKAGFEGDNDACSWKLVYPLDGWMAEIHAESRFPFTIGQRRVGTSVRARYAHSIGIYGTSTDTDWDSVGVIRDYSESDCEADIIIWDIDATFSVQIHQQRFPMTLEVGALVGYGTQSFGFTNTNLHTTIWDYRRSDHNVPGVVTYYDMEIHTGRVGVFLDMQTHEKLRYYLEATYVPYLEANADAYWVLRKYKFWQEAEGKGYTLTFRAGYAIWDHMSLFTSIRQVSLVADQDAVEGGVIGGDHYENEPIVSEITSKYFGIEVGAVLRF